MAGATFGAPTGSAGDLVGRRTELNWLRSRYELATRGFPHLVVIEGEQGIGKTRLATEALADARRAGATVLRGRCYDHLDLAYLPLRESLFAAIARRLTGTPGRDDDLKLLSQLRARSEGEADVGPPGGDRAGADPPPPLADRADHRVRATTRPACCSSTTSTGPTPPPST